MKTRYEHVNFVEWVSGAWGCYNNRSTDKLGEVRWYSPWQQFCYFPTVQAVYSTGCLNDIVRFIGQLVPPDKRRSGGM